MAQLCLGLATSHLAHIVNARALGDPRQVAIFDAGFQRLAEALDEAAPDVSLIISAEHVNKFFIDNMPAFAIGMFDEFAGPVESKTRNFGIPYRRVPSAIGFARHLIELGLDEGVDWAVIESWEVDHGFMAPLFKLDPEGRHPMVPVFVNGASPPLPSPRRCYAVGRWLADAIARWDADKRVAIIATGGLSHSVGSVQQGWIDVRFRSPVPRRFLRRTGRCPRRIVGHRNPRHRIGHRRDPKLDHARRSLRRPNRRAGHVRAHQRLRHWLRAGPHSLAHVLIDRRQFRQSIIDVRLVPTKRRNSGHFLTAAWGHLTEKGLASAALRCGWCTPNS